MMLGNIGLFLLAPFLATSSFIGFGANDGYAFVNAKNAVSNRWSEVTETGSSWFDNSWNWGQSNTRSPRINNLAPDSGEVGTEVALSGSRFAEDSVVRFGDGVINDVDVSANGRSLSFTVPEYMGQYCPPNRVCTAIALEVEPGDYQVRVVSDGKTSNSVEFTLTEDDEDTEEGLAINSIDGPTALVSGTEGSWTVNVSGSDSDLRYSVKWGDERLFRSLLAALSDDESQSSATFTHTYHEAGEYTPEFTVEDADGTVVSKQAAKVTVSEEGTVHIDSIEPAATEVGKTVTLTGSGFDGDTKVWLNGSTSVDVEVESDSKLTFVIPSLAAGDYQVTVTSDEGSSNQVSLKVQETIKGRVSVTGIDAPSRLEITEEGTWTVHATTNLSGNLRYSVDWGENNLAALSRRSAVETQSSASFTHSYVEAGTYKPKFTVVDEQGNKASVSATVVVR